MQKGNVLKGMEEPKGRKKNATGNQPILKRKRSKQHTPRYFQKKRPRTLYTPGEVREAR